MLKYIYHILAGIAIVLLAFFIRRDIMLEKQYTGDLRNRIVGARLQKDGKLPYFYKWQVGDSTRYYDPQNFDGLAVSNITATPFLHQLLSPIADLPQRRISKIWLIVEYVSILLIVLLALSFAKSRLQQWAVVFFSAVFLFTAGWENHIQAGQYYLLIPTLAMLFYYLINRKNLYTCFTAGVVASSLVFLRPNMLWFFLPFLIIFFAWSWRYKIIFGIAALLPLLFTIGTSQKITYWNDFRSAMKEQVKAHQSLSPTRQNNAPDPHYVVWEGWDKQQIQVDATKHPFHFESEHGNLFVMSRWLLHINLPVWSLVLLPALFLFLIAFIYKKKKINPAYSLAPIMILAFCLYMLSDICSPFHRFQYNTAQWVFSLLLAAAYFNKKNKWLYAILLVGLLLNIIEIPSIGWEHTAGEYLIFLILSVIGFRLLTDQDKINSPA